MTISSGERALILAGLFELRITHLEHDARCWAIEDLAVQLGGDPSHVFFGGHPREDP
jgi:hypothetical protein